MGFELLPPIDVSSFPGLMGANPGADIEAAQQARVQQQQAQQDRIRTLANQKASSDAIHAVLSNPTPQNVAAAITLNPAIAPALKQAHDVLDADAQRQALNDYAALHGNLQAGNIDAAKAAVQARIDADTQAGRDPSDDQNMLSELDTPEGVKAVQGALGVKLASIIGPEAYAKLTGVDIDASKEARAVASQPSEIALRQAQAAEAQHNADKPTIIKDSAGGEHIVERGAPPVDPNAPQAVAAASATPAPTGGVYDQVAQAAAAGGASGDEQAYVRRLAQVESNGKLNAKNGSSTGVFQFHPDTFAHAGGGNINDVGDQTKAALNLSRQDRVSLQHAGLAPTDANAYILHQQGAGGGLALLTAAPDVNAIAALTPIYRSAKTARQAIVNNGGTPDMTAGQFVQMWQSKWSGQKPGQATATPVPAQQGYHTVYDAPEAPDTDVPLTPSTLTMLAGKYLANGTVPPFGNRDVGTKNRNAFYNRANEMATALGLTPDDLVAGTASTKALTGALVKGTALTSQLQASEATLNKNLDVMLGIARQGGVGGTIPVFNRWIQAGRKATGDPQVTALNNAVDTAAAESAALMTRATGSGGAATSDAAMREAHDRFDKAGTLEQLEAAAQIARTDGHNRVQSNQDMVDGLRNQLRAGPNGAGGAGTPPPSPAPAPAAAGASGVGPNGHSPIFTPAQFRAAAANPANKGHLFYDTDGHLRAIP